MVKVIEGSKSMKNSIVPDYDNLQLAIQFKDGTDTKFNLGECPAYIRDRLALHGAKQMAAEKVNREDKDRVDDCESAFEVAEETIAHLYEQFPEKSSMKEPRGLLIKAISRVKDVTEQRAAEAWSTFAPEKRKEFARHPLIELEIAKIKCERAGVIADQYKENLGKPAKSKEKWLDEKKIEPENRQGKMRFSNGKQLNINLSLVKNPDALALYGAEQKIRDSYAGIAETQEKVAAAEKVIQNLYGGEWSSRGEGRQQQASSSLLDAKLVAQLVEWMRWPESATRIAVARMDEQDKLTLMSAGAKQCLILCSREVAMDENPNKCGQKDIAGCLDEVIDRLAQSQEH